MSEIFSIINLFSNGSHVELCTMSVQISTNVQNIKRFYLRGMEKVFDLHDLRLVAHEEKFDTILDF